VNKDMLADLTHYDEDDADCISVWIETHR
jgi:hypothetical protein